MSALSEHLNGLANDSAGLVLSQTIAVLRAMRRSYRSGKTPDIGAMVRAVDGHCDIPQEVPVAAQVDGGRDARVALLVKAMRKENYCPVCGYVDYQLGSHHLDDCAISTLFADYPEEVVT